MVSPYPFFGEIVATKSQGPARWQSGTPLSAVRLPEHNRSVAHRGAADLSVLFQKREMGDMQILRIIVSALNIGLRHHLDEPRATDRPRHRRTTPKAEAGRPYRCLIDRRFGARIAKEQSSLVLDWVPLFVCNFSKKNHGSNDFPLPGNSHNTLRFDVSKRFCRPLVDISTAVHKSLKRQRDGAVQKKRSSLFSPIFLLAGLTIRLAIHHWKTGGNDLISFFVENDKNLFLRWAKARVVYMLGVNLISVVDQADADALIVSSSSESTRACRPVLIRYLHILAILKGSSRWALLRVRCHRFRWALACSKHSPFVQ